MGRINDVLYKVAFIILIRLIMMKRVRSCKNKCYLSKRVHQFRVFLNAENNFQCMASDKNWAKSQTLNDVPHTPPLFPSSMHFSNRGTFTSLNNIKTRYSIYKSKACKQMQLSKKSSQKSIILNFGDGRLGNQMCNFASQYALHKEFGVKSYFKNVSHSILSDTFDMPSPRKRNSSFQLWDTECVDPHDLKWAFISNIQLIQQERTRIFTYLKFSHYVRLETYVCDIKGFLPYIDQLKTEIFRFKKDTMKAAKIIVRKLRAMASFKKPIFVSIHIRLTDMGQHLVNFNVSLASIKYFTSAMEYMKTKYGNNVVFVVFSDDISNARRTLRSVNKKRYNIVFPSFGGSSKSASVSLAVLSLADHSILTYSTFGLWGALLRINKGDTIMPEETKKTDIGFYAFNANIPGLTFL